MIKRSLILSFALVCFSAVASRAEEVKITTYYPSPHGAYKGLSSTDDTTLATGAGKTLLVGATTYSFGTPPKLYVLGSAEADAFRAFEATGVNAFIEAKADPVVKWANIGGYNKSTNGFAPTHLDGSPLALQAKSLSNVGIGTATPDASAVLDITSNNKGFLPPRVFNVENNVPSPAAGLIVYDTNDDQMKYYNGTVWVAMGGGGIRVANGYYTGTGGALPFNVGFTPTSVEFGQVGSQNQIFLKTNAMPGNTVFSTRVLGGATQNGAVAGVTIIANGFIVEPGVGWGPNNSGTQYYYKAYNEPS